MNETVFPVSPFKGLVPYAEEDAPFFFGRDREIEIITANLLASRLTLLYGPSGVGKSSVLRAGVEYRLRQQMQRDLEAGRPPETSIVVFPGPGAGRTKAAGTWRGDPVAMIEERVYETLAALPVRDAKIAFPDDPPNHFAEFLEAWTRRCDTELLIVLDQFEEYFLYHGQDALNAPFLTQFPKALNRRDLHVNFLISIREDSVAKLDLFKGRIPNLFDNYLRIDHLDRESARAAIEKPLIEYNKLNRLRGNGSPDIGIEPILVEELLVELKTGKVTLSGSGRGTVAGESNPSSELDRIETPYLQLVMTRLWNEERQEKSLKLRLETLCRLGGSTRIVRTHLDRVMSSFTPEDQQLAALVFNYLVTPSGTKIAHSVEDLAAYAEMQEHAPLAQLLDRLCQEEYRILRKLAPPPGQLQINRYEIFHDVLAAPILDWRIRYQAAKKVSEAKATAEKKLAEASKQLAWLPWIFGFLVDLFLCLPFGSWLTIRRIKKGGVPLKGSEIALIVSAWVVAWLISMALLGAVIPADDPTGAKNQPDSPIATFIFLVLYMVRTAAGPLAGKLVFRWLKRKEGK